MKMRDKQLEVMQEGLESAQLMEQVTLTMQKFEEFSRFGECVVETYEQLVGVLAMITDNDGGAEIQLVHHMLDRYTICYKD